MWGALLGLAAAEAQRRAAQAAQRAALRALAVLLALIGLGFLLAAGLMATAQAIGAIPATLILGGGFLLLAASVALVARLGQRKPVTLPPEALAALNRTPEAVSSGIAKAPGLALLGAFVGGLILALKLRR